LQAQTLQDFEIILIDDASTDYDATLEILKNYPNLRIKTVHNPEKTNGAFARNCGIKLANGEYIAFLDADDSWPVDRLKQAKIKISNIKTNRFIIYGKFELIQNNVSGALVPFRGIRDHELVSEYVFASGQLMQTSTFICPRTIALEIMFDDQLTRHQDSDFMMRAQQKNVKLVFDNKKCANYFITPIDILERINSGRISVNYCNTWLQRKSMYFNKKSISGYNLTVTSRILYLTERKKDSLLMVVKSIFGIGIRNFFELMFTKIYIFLKLHSKKY